MKPEIELVSTGLELLSGRTVNTHAHTLARQLHGFRLVRDTTVPDDRDVIRQAVSDALGRVELVVVSGGLGPTSDDLTREAVAELAGVELVMHEPSRQAIHERYAKLGRKLNESVDRHALVLQGAEVLMNPVGLAPGEHITIRDRHIFLLPGPPHEFEAILVEYVQPRLAKLLTPDPPDLRVFELCGIGESDLTTRLGDKAYPGPGLDVAYCASIGRVEVRLWGPPERAADLDRAAAELRRVAGDFIYAERFTVMEEVVAERLLASKRTLATAESCTGGLLAHRLTNLAGSSAWFLGGVVAYSNAVKVRELGVDEKLLATDGAVSEAVACQMAVGVRQRFGSDLGVGITGIAGPGGATENKPVGLVYIAVSDSRGVVGREHRFAGRRAIIKDWSSQMALDLLRRRLC